MLSDENIEKLAKPFVQNIGGGDYWHSGDDGIPEGAIEDFARAIEAEVRKQDDALIRQMLETIENSSPYLDCTHAWKSELWLKMRSEAIAAARARLGEGGGV